MSFAQTGCSDGETGTTARDDYLFIDNARFLSMIAIVMRHCQFSLFQDYHVSPWENAITQCRSFGVLVFFVNTAFLMAAWLARPGASVGEYWRTRLDRVGKPWLIWAGAFQIIGLIKYFSGVEGRSEGLPHHIWKGIFLDNYWFVPVLLFSLMIFLPLRRYWRSWLFGLALLILSWFYGINQYAQWVSPAHTTAFFGYLFYLWLGVQLFQHFNAVRAYVQGIPWWFVLLMLCLAIGLMLAEDEISISGGFRNHYNALQNSNQVYTLVVLVVLIKLPVRLVPSFIDVRKESYGIYLTHQIVGSAGRAAVNSVAGWSASGKSFFMRLPEMVENPFARFGIWFLWFGVVYTASLLLTKALRRTALAWIVGEKTQRA